jgi:hypothetical protein
MLDFLTKFKQKWKPANILNDDVSGNVVEQSVNDIQDQTIAQALCDHLNLIADFNDRLDSLNYLSDQAKSNFKDISYTTAEESLVNSITVLGGKDGTVDFALIQDCVNLMLEWYTVTAADSLTASYVGKI